MPGGAICRAPYIIGRRWAIVSEETKRGGGPAAAGSVIGPLWFGGWLFTMGFAKLIWWQAILALFVWPYFLGVAIK